MPLWNRNTKNFTFQQLQSKLERKENIHFMVIVLNIYCVKLAYPIDCVYYFTDNMKQKWLQGKFLD